MRLAVEQLDVFYQLLFLLARPGKEYALADATELIRTHDLSLAEADISEGLRQLSRRNLFQGKDTGYAHAQPELAAIYQQTHTDSQVQALIKVVRERDPAMVDAITFFEQSGFDVEDQSGSTLILKPQTGTRQKQVGQRVLARLLTNQVLKAADVRAVVEQVESEIEAEQDTRARIAFMIVNEPPDMMAYKQMDTFRWDEGIILIPLTQSRIRAALVEEVCEMELNKILNEYLAENPDLYNHRSPVRDEHYFGRTKDQQVLLTYHKQGQPLGIFALNKMGKTSFINNLSDHMTDRAVVVVDLQNVAKNARAVFFSLITGLVKDITRKWHITEFPDLRLLR